MIKLIKISTLLLCLLVSHSCEKYGDYTDNGKQTVVYIGSQRPLRTVVARRANSEMRIEMGAVLGGTSENNDDVSVDFVVDPQKLADVSAASKFTLLPEDYYRIVSDEKGRFFIRRNTLLGKFSVYFNKEKFINDPLTLGENYALPIRLTATSAETMKSSKDYTILVVKYIAPESGYYYLKGKSYEVTSEFDNTPLEGTEVVYSHSELIDNIVRSVETINYNKLKLNGISNMAVSAQNNLAITITDDYTVAVETTEAGVTLDLVDLGSSYNDSKREFSLKYRYMKDGRYYVAEDRLILRQDPELDMRFEEW